MRGSLRPVSFTSGVSATDEYLETQWEKLQQGEKALLTTYRTLDERYKNTNLGPVRQRRDAALAELEKQWERITEFAEAHPEFSERWEERRHKECAR